MDILLYFVAPIFTAMGFASTLSLGLVSVCNSVETGTPLDIVLILVCLIIGIPCAAWTAYACWCWAD